MDESDESGNCNNVFDPDNERIVALYRKFIAVYGTHYVQKLVLGAKRVYTTTMSSRDFSDLTRQSVDVSNTLSVQMQVRTSLACASVTK